MLDRILRYLPCLNECHVCYGEVVGTGDEIN